MAACRFLKQPHGLTPLCHFAELGGISREGTVPLSGPFRHRCTYSSRQCRMHACIRHLRPPRSENAGKFIRDYMRYTRCMHRLRRKRNLNQVKCKFSGNYSLSCTRGAEFNEQRESAHVVSSHPEIYALLAPLASPNVHAYKDSQAFPHLLPR
jgi:hypothetical protein